MNAPSETQPPPPSHHHRGGHGHGGASLRDRVVISTVIIGVGLFLVLGIPLLKSQVPSGSAVINAIGNLAPDPARAAVSDPDRDAVRNWLRRNSDDPHPEEVRWWPAREMVEYYKQSLAAAKEAAEDDPRLDDLLDDLEHSGPDRVCRLRYRTASDGGGGRDGDGRRAGVGRQDEVGRRDGARGESPIHDQLFVVRHGKARPLPRSAPLAVASRRYFPDDEGVR